MPAKSSSPALRLRPHPHLYEINTWAWLEQLSARLGRRITLAEVPDSEWDALEQLGFDIIWLMGVWQRSDESRRVMLRNPENFAAYSRGLPGWKPGDIGGSPYAVMQYVLDPRIGTWGSLDRVREKLRARRMALFLDFVGNHTAPDHPWMREHPEYYVHLSRDECERAPLAFFPIDTKDGGEFIALGRDPYFPPWKDVVQLNYFNPAARAALIAELREIARHCDGVRCDMAMLQLNDVFANVWGRFVDGAQRPEKEFWAEAHAALPGFLLLAEAYWGTEPQLLDLGFSFVYDKEIYDAVREIRIWDVRARLSAGLERNSRLARFLENHDEPRRAAVFGNDRLPAVGTLMATLPGMRFYHQGELEGRRTQLSIMLRTAADEATDPVSSAFFQKILRITNEDVFHTGKWNLLEIAPDAEDSAADLIAYEWRSGKSWKMIVVNLAGRASQGRVRLRDPVSSAGQYVFDDELNGASYPRQADETNRAGLFVRLEGFQAHLFDVSPP
ncbi:MAG: alpha-amylase family glycosyl hydrolase [Candidatus Acidiferrales bacterium]